MEIFCLKIIKKIFRTGGNNNEEILQLASVEHSLMESLRVREKKILGHISRKQMKVNEMMSGNEIFHNKVIRNIVE